MKPGDEKWLCVTCENEYNKAVIEEVLVETLRKRVAGFQLQDINCSKCRKVIIIGAQNKIKKIFFNDVSADQDGQYDRVLQVFGPLQPHRAGEGCHLVVCAPPPKKRKKI